MKQYKSKESLIHFNATNGTSHQKICKFIKHLLKVCLGNGQTYPLYSILSLSNNALEHINVIYLQRHAGFTFKNKAKRRVKVDHVCSQRVVSISMWQTSQGCEIRVGSTFHVFTLISDHARTSQLIPIIQHFLSPSFSSFMSGGFNA
jgi:hypothetical protein